jgi:hypothetical protein
LVRGLNDPAHYVRAAEVLLDRGFGKPKQQIDAGHGVQSLTLLHFIAATTLVDSELTPPPMIEDDAPTDLTAPALE